MRKLLVGLALLAFGGAAYAQQTVCVSFDGFCDGLELNIEPGVSVSGTWQNYDCTGVDATLSRVVPQGGGVVNALCTSADCATAQVFGWDLLLLNLNAPARTMTLVGLVSGSVIPLLINSPVTLSQSACPFAPTQQSGVPSGLFPGIR